MKVVVINGGRVGGNTYALAKQFIQGTEEAGHVVSTLNLFSSKINGCLGCLHCRSHNNVCVWKDDITNFLPTFLDADVVLMVSPVYWYGISAQLKMFIDRTFAIEDQIKDKKVYFISSCAAPEDPKFDTRIQYAVNSIEGYVACLKNNVEFKKTFIAYGMFADPDISKHDVYTACFNEGKNL